jgi:hypothetical protein
MTCQDCEKAAQVPHWCIYQRGCAGCEARMLEQTPACFAHVENLKRITTKQGRNEYMEGVTRSNGEEMAAIVKRKYGEWWEAGKP